MLPAENARRRLPGSGPAGLFAAIILLAVGGPAQATKALSLAEAIALAKSNRAESAQGEIDVALARVGLLQAAAQRAQLSVEAIYAQRYSRAYVARSMCGMNLGPCVVDTAPNGVDGVATLTVPLWSGWSVESNWSRARRLEDAAKAQREAIGRQLALDATRTYWAVCQLEMLLEVSQKARRRSEEVVSITRARSNAGIVPIVDYTRSLGRSLHQQADIAALGSQVQQARALLAAALQIDDEVVLTDKPPEPAAGLASLDELIEDAVRGRPEIAAARSQTDAQRLQVRSIYGALWPQINLVGSLNVHSDHLGTPVAMVGGLVIDWKIFDSLSTTIAGRQAELQRQRLAEAERRLRYTVAAEVRSAYAALKGATDRREALKQAFDAADTGVEVIRRRYKAGTALLIELLQAEDDLQQVELALASNAVDIALADGELAAAIGKQ